MDKGTQAEVKPYFSKEDKIKTARRLVTTRHRITSYKRMMELINSETINPIRQIWSRNPDGKGFTFTEADAESYFNYLLSIVAGTIQPKKPNDLDIAYEQVAAFAYAMRNEIQMGAGLKEDLFTYVELSDYWRGTNQALGDLNKALRDISKAMSELSERFDKTGNDFADILTDIKTWLHKYGKVLDDIDKDHKEARERVQTLAKR